MRSASLLRRHERICSIMLINHDLTNGYAQLTGRTHPLGWSAKSGLDIEVATHPSVCSVGRVSIVRSGCLASMLPPHATTTYSLPHSIFSCWFKITTWTHSTYQTLSSFRQPSGSNQNDLTWRTSVLFQEMNAIKAAFRHPLCCLRAATFTSPTLTYCILLTLGKHLSS